MIHDAIRNNTTSKVEISVEVKNNVEVSPETLAKAIWLMDDQQQVEFLNELAYIAQCAPLAMQLQAVTDNENLSKSARNLMEQIGNYSSKEVHQ